MLLGLVLLLGLAVIPLLGGRIARLATLRVRWIPAVAAAFAVQILIVNVFPAAGGDALHRVVHGATYVVIAVSSRATSASRACRSSPSAAR